MLDTKKKPWHPFGGEENQPPPPLFCHKENHSITSNRPIFVDTNKITPRKLSKSRFVTFNVPRHEENHTSGVFTENTRLTICQPLATNKITPRVSTRNNRLTILVTSRREENYTSGFFCKCTADNFVGFLTRRKSYLRGFSENKRLMTLITYIFFLF